jgi:hypothetical protein
MVILGNSWLSLIGDLYWFDERLVRSELIVVVSVVAGWLL